MVQVTDMRLCKYQIHVFSGLEVRQFFFLEKFSLVKRYDNKYLSISICCSFCFSKESSLCVSKSPTTLKNGQHQASTP